MEANVPPKRKEPAKSLRIKVISMGNAEVGKVSIAGARGGAAACAETCPLAERVATQQPEAPPHHCSGSVSELTGALQLPEENYLDLF